jgi:hypothetical protein
VGRSLRDQWLVVLLIPLLALLVAFFAWILPDPFGRARPPSTTVSGPIAGPASPTTRRSTTPTTRRKLQTRRSTTPTSRRGTDQGPTEQTEGVAATPSPTQASQPAAVPFRIASVTWVSNAQTGPSTAEPGYAVDVRIRIDPDSADVNVVCRDLSTGKQVGLDIGSRYTCILQNYDASAGTHTIEASITARGSGYTKSKSVSFTLTA